MAGKFRLAGVLRLRRLEEDGAKAALAGAHADLARTVEEAGGLAAYLDASPERPTTSAALSGLAASRAAASALFSVLESEERVRAHAVDEARADLARARAASLGLEKLQERHDAETARAEGRADQAALDEIASTALRTTRGTTTP